MQRLLYQDHLEELPHFCFLVMKAAAVKTRVMTQMTAHQRTVVATHLIRAAVARQVKAAAVAPAAPAALKIQIQMMNQKEREKRDDEVFDKRGCFQ